MKPFDLNRPIFVDLNASTAKGGGTVELKPEWPTQINADGIMYESDTERVLLPWSCVLRMRQPLE